MRTLPLITLLSLFLVGCAKIPTKTAPITPEKNSPAAQKSLQEHETSISKLTSWQAKGRMAISHEQKGTNVSYVWQQYPGHYQIRLFGPFGSGSVYITGYPDYVELKESNGNITRAESPDELLKKATGLNLPITGLTYWLRGLSSPHQGIQSQRIDSHGNLQHLAQQGWFIGYESYRTTKTLSLPSKLQLQNQDQDVKVKMVVTDWQF